MSALRLLANLLLAAVLVCVVGVIILAGWGGVVPRVWEQSGLADGVLGGAWMWIDGQPIYYRTWGPDDGSPVVLVHSSIAAGMETWRSAAEILGRAGLRVIAIDLKGYGHSVRDRSPNYTVREQAILVAKVLNPLQVRQATVVGHGRGCAIALQLALEQPQFVGRLVLVSPVVYDRAAPLWQRTARLPGVGRAMVWLAASGGPLWRSSLRQRFHDASVMSAEDWRRWSQPTHVVGTIDARLAMAASPRDSDLPDALPAIAVPVLILRGEQDSVASPRAVRRLKGALPQAELVPIPHAGYYVQVEQVRKVTQYIADLAHDPRAGQSVR